MIADLDHRVEEAGDEAGTETGEHELERDALRRRDRDAVVEAHMANLDEFVRDRTPTWNELEQLVDAARERRPRGSAPTACAGSARVTASVGGRPRATRAGGFPPIPSSCSSNGSCNAAGTPCTTRRRRRATLARVRVARVLAPRPRAARAACCSRSRASRCPTLLAGYWAWRDPGAGERARAEPVPVGHEPRTPGAGPRSVGRRAIGSRRRDLHEQHPGHVPRVRGRDPARARHGLRADLQRHPARRGRGARDRRGQRPAVLRARRSRTACSS